MSTITDASKILETSSHEGQDQSLVIEALRMLTSREGGLITLKQIFERNGLGHVIFSWIGTGENAPIGRSDQSNSGERMRCGFGEESRDFARYRDSVPDKHSSGAGRCFDPKWEGR
jgi:hypothetical protein